MPVRVLNLINLPIKFRPSLVLRHLSFCDPGIPNTGSFRKNDFHLLFLLNHVNLTFQCHHQGGSEKQYFKWGRVTWWQMMADYIFPIILCTKQWLPSNTFTDWISTELLTCNGPGLYIGLCQKKNVQMDTATSNIFFCYQYVYFLGKSNNSSLHFSISCSYSLSCGNGSTYRVFQKKMLSIYLFLLKKVNLRFCCHHQGVVKTNISNEAMLTWWQMMAEYIFPTLHVLTEYLESWSPSHSPGLFLTGLYIGFW